MFMLACNLVYHLGICNASNEDRRGDLGNWLLAIQVLFCSQPFLYKLFSVRPLPNYIKAAGYFSQFMSNTVCLLSIKISKDEISVMLQLTVHCTVTI